RRHAARCRARRKRTETCDASWKNGTGDESRNPMSAKPGVSTQAAAPPGAPQDCELVLRVMPLPADANASGDIFGGWIMAQVDLAGSVLPARIAKGRIATVAVKEFVFKQPVSVGDLLSFYARVLRVGTTSVTVHVEVYAERDPA